MKKSPKDEKRKKLDELLADEYVLVHINLKTEGLDIPKHLGDGTTVTLKLSRLYQGGMELEEDRIEANLLFGSEYYNCLIPYNALWGATGAKGENLLWPDGLSTKLALELVKNTIKGKTKKEPKKEEKTEEKPKRKASHLKRIK